MSEYVNKTTPETLGNVTADFLKWEATPLTRVTVSAAKGTKAGALVDFPLRSKKLVALTDEQDGVVVVQPHNCVIALDLVKEADITAAELTVDTLKTDGDAYGIVYRGEPVKATA